jgi:ribonuclease HI
MYFKRDLFDFTALTPDHPLCDYDTCLPPCKDSDSLWGFQYTPPRRLEVMICTDGSTFVPKPSGAAYVYITSNAHREFSLTSHTWAINACNNYYAELSVIHRALRSLPVTTDIVICTDSERAHLAISVLLRKVSHISPLTVPGRPFRNGILSALHTREAVGSSTTIRHVRSHTGVRDRASIGNEAADRKAHLSAEFETYTDAEYFHDTLENLL